MDVGPKHAVSCLRAEVEKTGAGEVRAPGLSALGRGALRLRLREDGDCPQHLSPLSAHVDIFLVRGEGENSGDRPSLPRGQVAQPRAGGSSVGPLAAHYAWRRSGLPRFLENPRVPVPCSSTPVEPTHQATVQCSRRGPRYVHDEGCHDTSSFGAPSHGLGTRCLRFVVGVAPALRKTRFPLLACSTGRDWLPGGFFRKVSELHLTSHPPFPGLAWRKDIPRFSPRLWHSTSCHRTEGMCIEQAWQAHVSGREHRRAPSAAAEKCLRI
jgi:hypothetical protein